VVDSVVTDADLQAYVDGLLPVERALAVEAHLAQHAEDARRVSEYRSQRQTLHVAFDHLLAEPVPAYLIRTVCRRPTVVRHRWALAAGLMAVSVLTGWMMRAYVGFSPVPAVAVLPRAAAVAHVVYSPEIRHPVEVEAREEEHLVRWLSKRLGVGLRIPKLQAQGYSLVGGRLLPGEKGPAAQFMYQDAKGQRLTLYVRVGGDDGGETAFRFAEEQKVRVFYWVDGRTGYALSGQIERAALLRVADAVYRELNR